MTHDNGASVSLDEAREAVNRVAMRKDAAGVRAQEAGREGVADRRFEEARVIRDEVLVALDNLLRESAIELGDLAMGM